MNEYVLKMLENVTNAHVYRQKNLDFTHADKAFII